MEQEHKANQNEQDVETQDTDTTQEQHIDKEVPGQVDGQNKDKPRPVLRVENLNKTYAIPNGKLQILQDINLEVQNGEFIAITGPSGSGKTTLLSLLGALDRPDSGEIWLEGIAVHGLRGTLVADFRRQQVGFVFQLFFTYCPISHLWKM